MSSETFYVNTFGSSFKKEERDFLSFGISTELWLRARNCQQKQVMYMQGRSFWKNFSLSWFPNGVGGEVGGVWEILVTVPLFFPTVPSRGWSKLGQETVNSNRPMSKLVGFNWAGLCSLLMLPSLFLTTDPRLIIAILIVFPVLTGSRLDAF